MPSNYVILCLPLLPLLCSQSFPALGSFPVSWLFASIGQSIGASALESLLLTNIQGWFPLGLNLLISWQSKGLSRVFSTPQFESISSLVLSLLYGPLLTSIHDYSFDCTDLCQWIDVCFLIHCLGLSLGFSRSSVGKESACNAGDLGSNPESGRSPGKGNVYPLQYSCLENPMDRGAWQATVHGVSRVRHDLATKPPLPRFVIAILPRSKSFNFAAAVTIHIDFGTQGNEIWPCFHFFLISLPWSGRTGCHDLHF